MNCANHPDRERAAFCQNCGKPLCAECVRSVGNSIFCEPCRNAHMAGTAAYGYGPIPPIAPQAVAGEPNPGIAALLGFIPGVGAMYNGQYAKGIVHLMVFALLVSLADDGNGVFGLFVAGWIAYMVIEAHHTARARRDGTPLPNPFGLNDLSERLGFGRAWPGAGPLDPAAGPPQGAAPFTPPNAANPNAPPANPYAPPPYSYNYHYTYVPPVSHWGAPQDTSAYGAPPAPPVPPYSDPNLGSFHRFPTGAIWLIVLGLVFLAGRLPLFIFHGHVFAPLLMIGFGVWLFVRKMLNTGHSMENDGSQYYRWRLASAIGSSFWIVLIGGIWLLDGLHILSWAHSWPLFLIAAGLFKVLRGSMFRPAASYSPPPGYPAAATPVTPSVTSTELARTGAPEQPGRNDQEGR